MVGIVEALMFISRLSILMVNRPSWGILERAMSMLDRILRREMIRRIIDLGGAGTS